MNNFEDKLRERFSSGETVVVSKDGELYLKQTGELLSKEQFLQRLMVMPDDPVSLSLRRSDLMPEYQQYSNTQIARKLGDSSLALTMIEMSEDGKDVWE